MITVRWKKEDPKNSKKLKDIWNGPDFTTTRRRLLRKDSSSDDEYRYDREEYDREDDLTEQVQDYWDHDMQDEYMPPVTEFEDEEDEDPFYLKKKRKKKNKITHIVVHHCVDKEYQLFFEFLKKKILVKYPNTKIEGSLYPVADWKEGCASFIAVF